MHSVIRQRISFWISNLGDGRNYLIRYNESVTNPDDIDLAHRVAQGDERAFLMLYDRYAARVHALTLRILSDPMQAEEATQDTFLKLWSRARLYLS